MALLISDDTLGRVKTYEAIVKGQNVPNPGIPEAFKVLIKELQSLALDVKVLNVNNEEIDLKQNFDDDDDFVPQASDDANMELGVDEGDLDEGFMAEDEDGISELDLGEEDEDFGEDYINDESDLFLSDDEE